MDLTRGPTHRTWACVALCLLIWAQGMGCCSAKKSVPATKADTPKDSLDKRDVSISSTLPEDLMELSRVLAEIVGEEEIARNIDPRYDDWGNSTYAGPPEYQAFEREKRFAAGILAKVAAPLFTTFAGSLLKPMLSQIIFRPGKQTYKSNLLSKFLPRALSSTNLEGSAIEEAVCQQLAARKYSVALQTLTSHESRLDAEHYLPERFKESFNAKHNSEQLVAATRCIFGTLTKTLDEIISTRLTSAGNLLTSLITSLIEELRLHLEEFHDENRNQMKLVLKILQEISKKLEICQQPDNGGLYACFSSVLVLVALIFPSLIYLRNSLTSFQCKLQRNQIASILRRAQKQDRDGPDAELMDQGGFEQIDWPETATLPNNATLIRGTSFRGEIGPQGARQTEMQQAYSVSSCRSMAAAGDDHYASLHRTSGAIRPNGRPRTIHEAQEQQSQSGHPQGAYSKLVPRD